jgi:hypothetical protein
MDMNLNSLIENDIIGPDEDSPGDQRQMEIHALENEVAQYYFRVYQQAGIELFSDQSIPVSVTYYEETQMVEVMVETDDSFTVQALIGLSEKNAIGPGTVIRPLSNQRIDLTTEFPAADTPFKKFMTDTVSVGAASSSGSDQLRV